MTQTPEALVKQRSGWMGLAIQGGIMNLESWAKYYEEIYHEKVAVSPVFGAAWLNGLLALKVLVAGPVGLVDTPKGTLEVKMLQAALNAGFTPQDFFGA